MLDDLQMGIAEAPDSPEPYLVYADWLQSQSDAHGELIQLMYAFERETDPSRFLSHRQRIEALRAEHEALWLNQVKVLEPHWRWGFVRSGRLMASSLRALAESRAGQFPRELALTGHASALQLSLDWLPVTVSGVQLEPTYRDELVNLTTIAPQVQRLALGPSRWQLPPHLPRTLRDLRLQAPIDDFSLSPFLRSPNRLHTLHLDELPFAAQTVLEDASAHSSLRQLSLVEDLADDTLHWLASSPLLRQLDRLTVGGPFTDRGVDVVLRQFDRFSRISELTFWGGVVSGSMRAMAKKQLPQLLLLKHAPERSWWSTPATRKSSPAPSAHR